MSAQSDAGTTAGGKKSPHRGLLSRLTFQVGMLLLFPFLCALLTLAVASRFLHSTRTTLHFLNVASRHDVRAAQLAELADAATVGAEVERRQLAEHTRAFDQELRTLRWGGSTLGVNLDPPHPDDAALLERTAGLWARALPSLTLLSAQDLGPGSPSLRQRNQARSELEQLLPELSETCAAVSAQVVSRLEGHRARVLRVLVGALLLAVSLFALGIWLARRYVALPIRRLIATTQRFERGDWTARAPPRRGKSCFSSPRPSMTWLHICPSSWTRSRRAAQRPRPSSAVCRAACFCVMHR